MVNFVQNTANQNRLRVDFGGSTYSESIRNYEHNINARNHEHNIAIIYTGWNEQKDARI